MGRSIYMLNLFLGYLTWRRIEYQISFYLCAILFDIIAISSN